MTDFTSGTYDLTHPQKRIWYTEKTFPGTSVATIGGIVHIQTEGLDVQRLIASIRHLFRTSDALRLRFAETDGIPHQHLTDELDLPIEVVDFTGSGKEAAMAWAREQFRIPLPITGSRLCSFQLGLLGGDQAMLLLKQHHLISDGHSMVLTVNRILDTYLELQHGVEAVTEPGPSYLDFLDSERQYEASPRFEKDRRFWLDTFSELPEPTLLKPYDLYTPDIEAARYSYEVPGPVFEQLKLFCSEHRTNMLTVFLAAFYVYLYKVTGMEDLVVGTNILNRTNSKEKQTLGMFTSTTPVRMKVESGMNFAQWVELLAKEQSRLIRHQRYPFDLLFTELKERNSGLDRLFHILMEYQVMDFVRKPGMECRIEGLFAGAEALDMAIHIKEHVGTGALLLDFDYHTQVYAESEIEQLCGRLLQLIGDAIAHPDRKVTELRMVGEQERRQVLHAFNDTARDYPKDRLIHQGFERKAAETPDHPAIITDHETVSYRELNERANRIARCLRETGVGPGTHVGLLVSRSVGMIAAMLGIAKSGGAYVPMEPSTPTARIERIMNTLGATHLVTERPLETVSAALYASCPALSAVLFVDEAESMLTGYEGGDLPAAAEPDHTAYVIFTSGSTGVPKGVIVAHRTVSNLIDWVNRTTEMGADDRLLFVTSPTFDLSVYDVFGLLTAGGTIRLAGADEVRQPDRLLQLLLGEPITCWNSAPAALQQLAPLLQAKPGTTGGRLRLVLLSGDWIPLKLPGVLKEAFPGVRVLALGGATEATVWSNVFEVDEVRPEWASIPYGKPIQNARYYILDPGLQPCPIGVPGELYIGGDCLAVGYDDPQLTAERFLPDPFAAELAGETIAHPPRMYRTGDRARWMPDGHIEFLGRIDHQVKIRGYRIELGEIQAQLVKHPSVREAIAIDRQDEAGEKYICAYLVMEENVTVSELRGFLADALPDYMIPAHFVRLEGMPVTANGKLDRKALPEPDGSVASGTVYVAPRNEVEAKLASIWEEVLQRQVGIKDDFFKLGGHSLLAARMAARVYQQLGVELPLRILFVHSRLEQLSEYVALAGGSGYSALTPAPISENYPLSSAQRRLFIVSQMEDLGTAYHMSGVFRIEGEADPERLEGAFAQLIRRHEALRTSFDWEDGEPVQRVHDRVAFRLEKLEAGGELRQQADAFIRPFDLRMAPLLRAAWVKNEPGVSYLLFDMHHLISDGVSMNILMKELAILYEGGTLTELALGYKDYAIWQQRLLKEERLLRQERYWLEQFSRDIPVLNMPTDRPRPAVQSFGGDSLTFAAGASLTGQLQQLAEQQEATLFMVLLGAYQVLLAKYSGQEDIVVGCPVAGRSHPDLEPIVGMFVNMLPLRVYPSGKLTFTEYLQQVKASALLAFENEEYPFEELVQRLHLQREASRNPLFDTVFALQNLDVDGIAAGGLTLKPSPLQSGHAKFDLLLEASLGGEGLTFTLEYRTSLFDAATMERLGAHYIRLLQQLAEEPGRTLADMECLTEAEKAQLLAFNNVSVGDAEDTLVLNEWFEEQARLHPANIALVHGREQQTYGELNERANRLARTLRARGVGPDKLVALLTDRSIDMIVSILAVLKAGGAYVPIDPLYPEERIQYILEDSGVDLLITNGKRNVPSGFRGTCLRTDDPSIYDGGGTNLQPVCNPGHLAYVIYTSGTTGQPKGTMITHAGVQRIVKHPGYVDFTREDRMLQASNYAFDGSVIEIFGALLNGAQLVLVDAEVITDLSLLAQVLEKHAITILFCTTALFNALVEECPHRLTSLRKMMFGGEKASVHHVRKALGLLGPDRLVNLYGPTETTVLATAYEMKSLEEAAVSIPIGRPVQQTRLYVVDRHDKLVPIGVPGELCAAGIGLSRGYWQRPELTAEKFAPCPFEPGERMYRTGDLVRWLPDGTLEYLDRLDQQVKVRGFRVELGEIESRLLELDMIKEVAVTANKDANGQTMLCAYMVADREWTVAGLRAALAQRLPDYMIPHVFMQLTRIPLTANGKVDRRALPEPDLQTGGAKFEAPTTLVGELLADIWKTLLGAERIGVHDHFFHLGGDSIKAIQAAARLQKFGYKLGVRDFFAYPTITELEPRVQRLTVIAPQEPVVGELVPGPVQSWFFERAFAEPHHFNQSVMLFREEGWNEAYLQTVFQRLVVHHDVLRMRCVRAGSHYRLVQQGIDEAEVRTCFTLETAAVDARHKLEQIRLMADEQQAGLDLEQGPLLKAKLFHADEGSYLLIVIHHLVVDGVSWRILLEDLAEGYDQSVRGEPVSFAAKTHAYQAWTAALNRYASSEELRSELAYWQRMESKPYALLPRDLPDFDAYSNTIGLAQECSFTLTAEETEDLLKHVHHAYHTEIEDVLLAALALAVKDWARDERVLVLLEGHGREPLFPELDVSRTVGWFTSQYPVMLELDSSRHPIISVKEQLRSVPSKGIGYGVLKYMAPAEVRDSSVFAIEPEISFNYLGQIDQESVTGGFVLSDAPMGWQISPNAERISLIGIHAVIQKGRLTVKIDYNPYVFQRVTMHTFAEGYRRHLTSLIRHCLTKKQSELTSSDVSSEEITQEDLEDLFSLLSD
ncbi:non-ribosomal peptide synthetase [Paenibacillus puerhi]|uniref:non-ribosomal peptide synthetase n=1 Tax=Paenibacillus puerhi TaxID=2692622 RepID=UPI00135A683E|nr:non-ribosomal peptide synthetase [Paenibacillus puerhi]